MTPESASISLPACQGVVLVTQTTFLDLSLGHPNSQPTHLRIRYRRPLERSRLCGHFTSLHVHDDHPLLAHYTDRWQYVSVAVGAQDAATFFVELAARVNKHTLGWRAAGEYINPWFLSDPTRLHLNAMGVLFEGPATLLDALLPTIRSHISRFSVLSKERPEHGRVRALTLDRMFVVAEDFQVASSLWRPGPTQAGDAVPLPRTTSPAPALPRVRTGDRKVRQFS